MSSVSASMWETDVDEARVSLEDFSPQSLDELHCIAVIGLTVNDLNRARGIWRVLAGAVLCEFGPSHYSRYL